MELIFNELSLASPAPDRDTGHGWMQSLSETILAAVHRGVAPFLRTCGNFWGTDLSPNYTLAHWSVDRTVDRDLKRHIMTITGKAPFIETLHGDAEDKADAAIEFSWNGFRAIGLGFAALRDDPAVSMSADSWRKDSVEVHCYLETAEGSKKVEKEVRHWYETASVTRSYPWLRERLGKEIVSGKDLLRKRHEILRRLDFTPNAMEQIEDLTGNERQFSHVVHHLLALNHTATDWTAGPFVADPACKCSPESAATMQQFGHHRTIRCADGIDRVFSWHAKINVEAWRIHFLEMPASHRVMIGYVGPHLPTVGDPH